MGKLSLADRATIANMSPEYGATMGFFPVDHVTLDYLKLTGRSDETVCFLACIFFVTIALVFCGNYNHEIFINAYISWHFARGDVDASFSSWLCSVGTVTKLKRIQNRLSQTPCPIAIHTTISIQRLNFIYRKLCEINSSCAPFFK